MDEQKAENVYKGILHRIVEPRIGKDSTYQNELQKAGVKFFGTLFKGVFPSDKIPVLNDLKKYAILNLDKSTEQGSHWIAVAYDKGKIYVYDSFGRKSTLIIPSIYKSFNGHEIVDTDYDAEQTPKEMNCGARCLSWLLFFDIWGSNNAILI